MKIIKFFFIISIISINFNFINNLNSLGRIIKQPVEDAALTEIENNWLALITSYSERERFQALNNFGDDIKLTVNKINKYFEGKEKAYIGTLIFFFTRENNPILYDFENAGINLFSKYDNYFPNVAVYFSKVNPQKGYDYLLQLYEIFNGQRLFICKAIGETNHTNAPVFFKNKITEKIQKQQDYFDEVIGLTLLQIPISKSIIEEMLDNTQNREVVIGLTKIKSDFDENDIIRLWQKAGWHKFFSLEYLLNTFEVNEILFFNLVEKEYNNKNYDFVRQLLMSDKIRKMHHPKALEFLNKL